MNAVLDEVITEAITNNKPTVALSAIIWASRQSIIDQIQSQGGLALLELMKTVVKAAE